MGLIEGFKNTYKGNIEIYLLTQCSQIRQPILFMIYFWQLGQLDSDNPKKNNQASGFT